MKIEEATKELKNDKALYETDIISAGDGTPDGDLLLALDMAISALEKQIPKKLPIVEELYHCPNCGEKDAVLQGDNYCFNCGQALDWSDEE